MKLKTLKDFERRINYMNDTYILRFNYSDGTWDELNILNIFLDIGKEKELEINLREQLFIIKKKELKPRR